MEANRTVVDRAIKADDRDKVLTIKRNDDAPLQLNEEQKKAQTMTVENVVEGTTFELGVTGYDGMPATVRAAYEPASRSVERISRAATKHERGRWHEPRLYH